MIAALRRRLDRTTGNEDGFTLLELVVVMIIMTVVLLIFTSGITQAFSAENKVDTSVTGENQLVIAFQRLDKQVRYAAAISDVGVVSNTTTGKLDPVVDWLTTYTGTSTCTEVRLNVGTSLLQQRTWTLNASPLIPTGWQTLAASISYTGTSPFVLTQPGTNFQYQRLEFAVTSSYGVNSSKSSKKSDVTFTALNTSPSTANTSSTTCTQARGVSW